MEKKDNGNFVLKILLYAFLFIFLMTHFEKCRESVNQYWQNPNFKTDTVYLSRPFELKKDSFPNYVPPKTVVTYTAPNVTFYLNIDSLIQVISKDHMDTTKIDSSYLTQFPTNPKLVYGYFVKDTLKLSLLKTDGEIYTEDYLVDYGKFRYEYFNNKLRAIEKPTAKLPSIKSDMGYYLYGGYDLINSSILVKPRVSGNMGRVYLELETPVTLNTRVSLGATLSAGYRFK